MYVSVLVGLLLYWKYANVGISPDLDDTSFWNFLETFLRCLYTSSKWLKISCMSLSLFIASLPYWIWVIFGYIQFWMRYLFQIFWKHSLDVCTLVLNNFRFLVCLSVCSLRHFLTKIMLSSSRWAIFFKFSAEISGILVH